MRYNELLDRLPELFISTPSTQTQTRDGGQNAGTDRSTEVLTQEQEHWTPEKQGIQEKLLDPLSECLSTPSTPTQTGEGVQGEQIEGSKDILTNKQEYSTLEKQHEIQEELLDPLPEVLFTPRSREVLTEEQEHRTLVKQHKIQEELLDPLPSQTQTRYGVPGELTESWMDVLTHEHLTLEKQHEIKAEFLDPLPEVLTTPSTQTQQIDEVQDGEIKRSMKVLTQEQEQCTLEKQHEMTDGVQDLQIGGSMEVVAQGEHSTLQKQHDIEKELLDPPPELYIPSILTQVVTKMQNRGIEKSMAVVSASHGAFGPLLEKLNALLTEEYGNLKGVRHEVRLLRSELTVMHALVSDFTSLEDPDAPQKTWMSMLRELSYDAEDCIDKFIDQFCNGGRLKQFVRKAARQLKTLVSRHEFAEIFGKLNVRAKELTELRSRYKLDYTNPREAYNSAVDPRLHALFVEAAYLVGIDGPRDGLAKWMVEGANSPANHHRRVLSIVGFGGLGKTTLANEVYRQIEGNFCCRAFVSVSQKPDVKKILTDLISQMSYDGLAEDMVNWDERRSITKLRELLQDKRYLIVIDDIWSVTEWEIIKYAFPENYCSSRIITTTRIMEVGRSCCTGGDDYMYNMRPLSDSHSKNLFFKRIFGAEEGPEMLEEVSNKILKKCGGLPLAIISIASLLANRPANKEEWEELTRSIGSALDKNSSLEGMKSILCLSYNNLSDNLKTCLLYLSNFPEGCVIERERLVRRWIAEGFISELYGLSQQEVAEKYFFELINRNMIQAVDICYDGKARACRVHDMMFELIISMSAKDNFVTVIDRGQTGLVKRHVFIRRLSVQHIDQNLASILATEDLSHVRSLTVTSSSCIEHLPSLARFENLRVLDFEGCDRLENYHMNGMDKLFQLKYLSLRGTWISHIPSEVVMLHSLETLDIRETDVEELPAGIVHLTKLQHLIASTDYGSSGIKIPNGIGNMKNLRILLGCGISPGSADALDELGNLANLNDLDVEYKGIGSEYKRHEEMFLSSLCTLGSCKLQSFRIRRCRGPVEFLESWSPPPISLQRFEMSGCYSFRCIPAWISPALTSLAYLEINIVEVTEKDLLILGEIPALLYLGLTCETFRKERLTFQGRGFRCLKKFVYDAVVLPSGNLLFEGGALPRLQDLGLIYCVSMADAYGFNLGIRHLPRLKNVQVRLYKEGANIAAAAFAITNEANIHPNRPRVTLTEHARRDDYCSEECPNRAVTDSELVASRTKQKRT